jgi:hypothetical protein
VERTLLAFWDGREVEVHRPTGQVFRFSARQAESGGHEVFAVGTNGKDEVWVLTGPRGSQRATRKARFSQTGMYRGNSAL